MVEAAIGQAGVRVLLPIICARMLKEVMMSRTITLALAGLVGGYLPGLLQHFGSTIHSPDAKRAVLLVACLIVALGAWPASRLRLAPESARPNRARTFSPFLLRFLPVMAVWVFVIGAFTPLANVYLSRHLRMPLPHVGLVFSASQGIQVLAVLVAPVILRKFGAITGIMYMQLTTAVALLALARVSGVPQAVFLYLCFTAAQWMSSPGIYSLLMNKVAAEERSDASAAYITVTSLFQAMASVIAGSAYERFGYPVVLSVIGGIAVLAAVLLKLFLGGWETNKNMTNSIPAGDNSSAG